MNEPKKRPCRFFMAGRCNHGAKCKWSHDQGDIDKLPPFGRDLMDWQSKLHSQRSPAHAIGAFFRQAQALIESDVQVRQEVIASLATDKGCVKMEELCNIQWAKLQGQQFHDRFARDFLPLLNILTDHRVISSGVLEAHTGTIFNFIFGRGGLRGKAVFELVLRHLEDKDYPEMGDNKPLFSAVSLFSLVVQVNQNARITPGYQEMFNRFVAVAETLYHPDVSSNIGDVRRHLREAAAHLDHGKEFPFLHELPRSLKVAKDVAFRLDRAGPGTKGPSGARHDNDHEDIENIQIMPTYDEIASTTTEYLPLLDADSWHKEGMPGLLDRHFRLLREDTIGQLRDKVRTELERLQHNADGLGAVPAGHWSFDNATVDAPFFDDYRGLEVVVSFDQPKHLNKMTFNDRKTHWERSRRLSADSVVCILTSGGKAIFCHVTREFLDTRRRKKPDETEDPRPSRDSVSLVHRADRASVLVRPVEHDRHSVEDLLYLHACPERVGQCTLVEFSGVLLPAFMPTLQALQNFSKSSAIPFTELLVPVGAPLEQHIPPPAYADGPDFTFDLSTICHSNLSMSLKPGQASHTDVRKLSDLSSLDPSQSQTLVDALSRQLALLQGPPGTGKSFVGVHLLRVLVAAKSNAKLGPIICVCYTNHALDQLLEHLLDAGISQIVRIGSASKSERISNLKLKDLAKKDDRTKVEKHEAWRCRSDMEEKAKAINGLLGSLTTSGNLDSLRLHLQSTAPDHATQLFGNDESDGEWKQQKSKKNNPTKKLNNWLKGGRKSNTIMPDRPVNDLLHAQLVGMSHQERNRLYDHWSKALFDQSYAFIDAQRGAFVRGKERHSTVRDELDLRVLEQADVIGVTTSGLANKLTALRRLSSKILLCEEAGEVLEAHLLTALLPQIEHAILIGDHLQLRPHVQYHLSRESREGEKYSLDLSLFERLVGETGAGGSRLPYSTLHTQRRMHPEISNLIKSTLYPGLIDGAPAYEPVHGMQKRLFWFDHENREVPKTGPEGLHSSHSNDFEVEMVTALVSHLIKQGQRRPDEIAVLTPYLGQLRKLKISLSQLFELFVDDRDEEDLRRAGLADAPQSSLTHKTALDQAVRVATIDNFQGEEAAIVVISLVRSNEKRQCGFLKTSNRINVLLSRAQQGMYIIGDAATCAGIPMWKEVIGIMDVNQCIGYSLPIECPRHPEDPIEITKPDDFLRLSPDGGCQLPCPKRLDCGHACTFKCHSAFRHDAVKCLQLCPRREGDLENCEHDCPRRCGERCPTTCSQMVDGCDIELTCGHVVKEVTCWISRHTDEYICRIMVTKTVPGCGHKVNVACCVGVGNDSFTCKEKCDASLSCGHRCLKPCSACNTRQDGEITQSDHGVCTQVCGRNYNSCSHSCQSKCHGETPCSPCTRPCEMLCRHSKCEKKCSEPCSPCAEAHCPSSCPHSSCSQPCAAPCDWIPCSKRCERVLPCGHQCPSLCGETCPSPELCQTCCNEDVKSTQVDLIMFCAYGEVDLDDKPCIFLQCGHIFTVESMDGLVELNKYYQLDADGQPAAFRDLPYALDIDQAKIVCPHCRTSLRNTARYGRPIRSALLIQSTLKFISWSNNGYVELMTGFLDLKAELSAMHEFTTIEVTDVELKGGNDAMIKNISTLPGSARYKRIYQFRKHLFKYARQVQNSEQPFRKVQDLVSFANRLKAAESKETFQYPASTVLQTKGSRMAACLILRCDLLVLMDFLSIHRNSPGSSRTTRTVDTTACRQRCEELITICAAGKHPTQEAESHLFLAQFAAVEVNFSHFPDGGNGRITTLRNTAQIHLDAARAIHAAHQGETKALAPDLEVTEKMLADQVFYTAVSDEEMRAVVKAMAAEFMSTGHWYRCVNGHAFTVGECGMPMEMARCSECGAAVGGMHHAATEGVMRANDLVAMERGLERMRLNA